MQCRQAGRGVSRCSQCDEPSLAAHSPPSGLAAVSIYRSEPRPSARVATLGTSLKRRAPLVVCSSPSYCSIQWPSLSIFLTSPRRVRLPVATQTVQSLCGAILTKQLRLHGSHAPRRSQRTRNTPQLHANRIRKNAGIFASANSHGLDRAPRGERSIAALVLRFVAARSLRSCARAVVTPAFNMPLARCLL